MASYVEETEFTLRLVVRCAFPDDYQGEEDGYEWVQGFRPITQDVVAQAMRVLAAKPGLTVRPGNRGRSTEDEVTLVIERAPA